MKINPIYTVNQAFATNKAKKSYGAQEVTSGKDTLALSSFAKELSVAKAAVEATPDIRQAKVDAIKKQLEAGTYNITAAQIADKLLNS